LGISNPVDMIEMALTTDPEGVKRKGAFGEYVINAKEPPYKAILDVNP